MPSSSGSKHLMKARVAARSDHQRTGLEEPAADDIVKRVARWVARDEEIANLQSRWQQLETALFATAVEQRIDCAKAVAGNSTEAKQMRALDVEIEEGFRGLAAQASEIQALQAPNFGAALAKIELGLRMQGPYDWRDHARELIDDGIDQLRSMMNGAGLPNHHLA